MARSKASGLNATLGDVAPNVGSNAIISPPGTSLDFTVEGFRTTEFPWNGPDATAHGDSIPALKNLGSAGGGHDDPETQVPLGDGPNIHESASAGSTKGGNLGPF